MSCSDAPQSMELSGKTEMLIWALTFLTSTWYIKNPFLKSKIVEVKSANAMGYHAVNNRYLQALFLATFKYDGRKSVLESVLNTHPLSLKYLMPALMHIYVGKSFVNYVS